MHFAFLHLVHVAEINEELVGLVERHVHVAEVHYESAELVEYEVGVLGCLFVELLFLAFHHALELSVQVSKPLFQSVGA